MSLFLQLSDKIHHHFTDNGLRLTQLLPYRLDIARYGSLQ